jgi:hypothetical protein
MKSSRHLEKVHPGHRSIVRSIILQMIFVEIKSRSLAENLTGLVKVQIVIVSDTRDDRRDLWNVRRTNDSEEAVHWHILGKSCNAVLRD